MHADFAALAASVAAARQEARASGSGGVHLLALSPVDAATLLMGQATGRRLGVRTITAHNCRRSTLWMWGRGGGRIMPFPLQSRSQS